MDVLCDRTMDWFERPSKIHFSILLFLQVPKTRIENLIDDDYDMTPTTLSMLSFFDFGLRYACVTRRTLEGGKGG